MQNIHGFLIEDGVLLRYIGSKTDVVIPEGVTEIGEWVFGDHVARKRVTLTSVTIPASVRKIGLSAFYGCTGLTSVTIPTGTAEIGGYAFFGCTGLKNAVIPESVTTIGSNAFAGCTRLTHITIPSSVREIEWNAFKDCTGLTDVTIPAGVVRIGGGVFEGCTGLTDMVIPEGVTEVGWYIFSDCTNLRNVTLPKSLTEINKYAFDHCHPVITAPQIPAAAFAVENRPGVCVGFARLYLENAELDEEIRTGYLKYIKNQKKKLFPAAVAHEELLRLMFTEKIVTRKDIDLLLAECDKQSNIAAKAAVLEYAGKHLKPVDPAKKFKLNDL